MSKVNPVEWANKRKAAIERAKQIKEEKKNGVMNGEEYTFAPQVNKRPSYLNKGSDSLDTLANEVIQRQNSSDIFEQPLPGLKSKALSFYNDDNNSIGANSNSNNTVIKLPSPGSDALGREMKKFPFGEPHHNNSNSNNNSNNNLFGMNKEQSDAAYKSQFLQQYETSKAQARLSSLQNNNKNTNNNYDNRDAPIEDEFANMLRNDNRKGKAHGPGWNDDTTSTGFEANKHSQVATNRAPKNRTILKENSFRKINQNDDFSDNTNTPPQSSFQRSVSTNGSRKATQQRQQQQQQQDWNQDTDFQYSDPPAPITRHRSQSQTTQDELMSSGGSGSVHQQARSKLSLLKSKIKRSERSADNNDPNNDPYNNHNNNANNGYNKDYNNSNNNYNNYSKSNSAGKGNSSLYNNRVNDDMPHSAPNNFKNDHSNDNRSSYNPNHLTKNNSVSSYELSPPNSDQPVRRLPPRQPSNNNSSSNKLGNISVKSEPSYPNNNKGSFGSEYDDDSDDYSNKNNNNFNKNKQHAASTSSINYNQPLNQTRIPKSLQAQTAPHDDPYGADAYPSDDPYGNETAAQPTLECPDCGRKFFEGPYEKHVKICSKVFMQKRKVFDSTKMRIQDNPELKMSYQNSNAENDALANANAKKAKWKEDSIRFREAMKAARAYSKAVESGGPLPPPVVSSTVDSSLIPCPHCGRRFSEKAGERHIPNCQNIRAKPTMLKKGGGGGGGINGAPVAMKASKKGGRM
eukprot:gene7853-10661_t